MESMEPMQSIDPMECMEPMDSMELVALSPCNCLYNMQKNDDMCAVFLLRGLNDVCNGGHQPTE